MESSTVAKIKRTQLSTPKFAVPCTSELVEDSIVLLAIPYSLVNKHMRLSLSMVRKYYVPVIWCVFNRGWNLSPPTISMFEHSSTRQASYEVGNSWERLSIIVHESMIRSHRWQKVGKLAILFCETRFEVEVKSPTLSQ